MYVGILVVVVGGKVGCTKRGAALRNFGLVCTDTNIFFSKFETVRFLQLELHG